jgi:hypothetical protein
MKKKKHDCHHEWAKSYEECIIFDDGVGEHTGISPKWICKKCGRVLRVDPNIQNY